MHKLYAELVAKEFQHQTPYYEKNHSFLEVVHVKLALRGHPAVTWLTVYRWLQVVAIRRGTPAQVARARRPKN